MKKPLIAVVIGLAVAGCSGDVSSEPSAPSSSSSTGDGDSEAQTPESTPEPTKKQCGSGAQEALSAGLAEAPQFPDTPWNDDVRYADIDGYDPCAPLSVISTPVASGAGHPISIQLLYSYGEYLYPATAQVFGVPSSTVRVGPNRVQINYLDGHDGESMVDASGVASSLFTLNEEETEIERTGELSEARGSLDESSIDYTGKPLLVDSGHRPGVPAGAYIGAGGPIPEGALQIPITGVNLELGRDVRTLMSRDGEFRCEFYDDLYWSGCGVYSYYERELYPSDEAGLGPRWAFALSGDEVPEVGSTTSYLPLLDESIDHMLLNPGEIAYTDVYACAASTYAMTCWNSETGHGVYMGCAGYESW